MKYKTLYQLVTFVAVMQRQTQGFTLLILSQIRDQSHMYLLESFHSQQEMEEHSAFIHNSQKNKHLCQCYAS